MQDVPYIASGPGRVLHTLRPGLVYYGRCAMTTVETLDCRHGWDPRRCAVCSRETVSRNPREDVNHGHNEYSGHGDTWTPVYHSWCPGCRAATKNVDITSATMDALQEPYTAHTHATDTTPDYIDPTCSLCTGVQAAMARAER